MYHKSFQIFIRSLALVLLHLKRQTQQTTVHLPLLTCNWQCKMFPK
jgi:hypothetical protein